MDGLTRSWLLLIALSLATTLLASLDGRIVVAGLLLLAWIKARLILGRFLHLRDAGRWLSAFTVPLAIWLMAIGVLYALVTG